MGHRGRERSVDCLIIHPRNCNQTSNMGMYPNRESKPRPCGVWVDLQPMELHWPIVAIVAFLRLPSVSAFQAPSLPPFVLFLHCATLCYTSLPYSVHISVPFVALCPFFFLFRLSCYLSILVFLIKCSSMIRVSLSSWLLRKERDCERKGIKPYYIPRSSMYFISYNLGNINNVVYHPK